MLDVLCGRARGCTSAGVQPSFRVGQADAELLDDELVELLRAQVGDALKFFGVGHWGGSGERYDVFTGVWRRWLTGGSRI